MKITKGNKKDLIQYKKSNSKNIKKNIKSNNSIRSNNNNNTNKNTKIAKINNYVSNTAIIGKNVKIWHFAYVGDKTIIGDNVMIGSLSHIDYNVKIGNNTRIEGAVYIPPLTVIGNNVFIGPGATFTNDPYPMSPKMIGVIVEDGAIIASRAVIKPGVTIGKNAVVGMGAVVTKDVPAETVVIGNPARIKYSRSEYNRKKSEWEQEEEVQAS
ncbi:MAG TPA: acyltransferase [Nitrososphaeraceae archaeon]|nr:acyltransferase [Nitrososphaeraceae archaeon]